MHAESQSRPRNSNGVLLDRKLDFPRCPREGANAVDKDVVQGWFCFLHTPVSDTWAINVFFHMLRITYISKQQFD